MTKKKEFTVDKQQQREQQPSTFIFPSKLGDLPTMVTSNASMLFSLTDSLINYNNGDSGEKTIGGAGDRPSSSSSSTPESSFSSLSTNNDRLSKSENIPKSDLAEVNPCNGNLPKRRSTTKNRNLDSATNASTMENNQNTLLSTFLQSMIMNSAAMAATMKNEQNDKNLNNEEIDNNKNQNVSVSSPIFPFANFFPSTLTASGQGQAQGFGFLPAGLAANGSLMYQMSQNLLYPPAGTENGTGEAPTPQQQYITIPFPVPFNQTMLKSSTTSIKNTTQGVQF
uniref:Uncharacterized protein n=1 Tax=Romanomermis culicivorax TaxID=13658 RepID=A0A915IBM9_ROMCU